MSAPAYYRPRVPFWLWLAVLVAALLAVVVFAARGAVGSLRAQERRRVYAEAQAWASQITPTERAAWRRQADSLRAVVTGRDTVLVTRLRTVRDTAWLPADTSPAVRLVACRAALDSLADDCDAFRVSAVAALAVADTVHRADSVTGRALLFATVAARDSLRTAQRQRDRAPTWRTVGSVGVVSMSAGALLCLVFCR